MLEYKIQIYCLEGFSQLFTYFTNFFCLSRKYSWAMNLRFSPLKTPVRYVCSVVQFPLSPPTRAFKLCLLDLMLIFVWRTRWPLPPSAFRFWAQRLSMGRSTVTGETEHGKQAHTRSLSSAGRNHLFRSSYRSRVCLEQHCETVFLFTRSDLALLPVTASWSCEAAGRCGCLV